jgi:hypothetical protein
LSEETCQNYESKNPEKFECSPIQRCKDCIGPVENNDCHAVENYPTWFASEYGTVAGVDNMKAEIL